MESFVQNRVVIPEATCFVRSSDEAETVREIDFGSKARIFYSKKIQRSASQEQQVNDDHGVIRAPILNKLLNAENEIVREMIYFSKNGDYIILNMKPLLNQYELCGDKRYFCESLSNYFDLSIKVSDIDGNREGFSLSKLEGKLHQYKLIPEHLEVEDVVRSLVTHTLKEVTGYS